MENSKNILTAITLIALLVLVMPYNVLAVFSTNAECIRTDENYLIYVEGMLDKTFQYALSNSDNLSMDSMELTYIASALDEANNNIAVIPVNSNFKYLYIKEAGALKIAELDLANAISKKDIEKMEKLTELIDTEIVSIELVNEKRDQVQYIERIGGIKITEEGKSSKFKYVDNKLPEDKYSRLEELVGSIKGHKNTYKKIVLAKEMNSLFNQIIDNANNSNKWKKIDEDKVIVQPDDAQSGDKYAYLIKNNQDGIEKYDIQFVEATREETSPDTEVIKKNVNSATKLPNTFDVMITLFVILAIIIIAIIITQKKRKKFSSKGSK